MKVGVCLKQVPPTQMMVSINATHDGIETDGLKWEINIYDEFAVERALQMKDAKEATEVVLFTVGGPEVEGKIRDMLGKGADRAVRLDDPAFEGSDALGIARILAAAIAKEEIDVVLAGKQALGGDQAQVPQMIAEILDWPQATVVDQLEKSDDGWKAWRRASGGVREIVELPVPFVVSCEKGIVKKVRLANLMAIRMAKKKELAVRSAADIGVDVSLVGAEASSVSHSNWIEPTRPSGRILEGDNPTRVRELVRLLREEAKVI